MSAVEVITAALAAGAGVGVKDAASAAVKDAYAGLKALLKQHLAGHGGQVVQALEGDETEPAAWQARIGDALAESGAADDEQVLDAARRLLATTASDKAQALHIDVDTNYGAIGEFHAPVAFHQALPVPPTPPAVG
jgi:GTP cyclohydrolase III